MKSRMLGRLLNLPRSIVDSIFDDSKDCLLFILDEWLKQDLDASWSAIAGALKNPLINYSRLANTIEKKYNLPPSTWSGKELHRKGFLFCCTCCIYPSFGSCVMFKF